ncbi:MAG: hypothetical protein RL434_230 [Pseudomonadota bacterium]|jgi:hypothetical protein
MICFVITWPRKTLRRLRELPGMPRHRIWSYDALFRARRLPKATWIFTDFDRLAPWDLELAAHVYRELAASGQRVLNDPALAVGRFDLLAALRQNGRNSFSVWRAVQWEAVDQFPVFLRTEAAHRGPLTDLIHDAVDLGSAVKRALADGHPLRDLMVVEYCAQPMPSGIFRKKAAFRLGDRLVNTLAVHDTSWSAKHGQPGVADESLYQEELNAMARCAHEAELMAAFDVANLQYGRVDYSLVDGKVQVYEINSNPTVGRTLVHPNATRLRSSALAEELLVAALQAIDSPAGGVLSIKDELLARQRRVDRFLSRSRWVA